MKNEYIKYKETDYLGYTKIKEKWAWLISKEYLTSVLNEGLKKYYSSKCKNLQISSVSFEIMNVLEGHTLKKFTSIEFENEDLILKPKGFLSASNYKQYELRFRCPDAIFSNCFHLTPELIDGFSRVFEDPELIDDLENNIINSEDIPLMVGWGENFFAQCSFTWPTKEQCINYWCKNEKHANIKLPAFDDKTAIEKINQEYDNIVNEIDKTIEELDSIKNNEITIVPSFYQTEEAVEKMLFLYMNKRADSIKELVNLYEQTEWQSAMVKGLDDINNAIVTMHDKMIEKMNINNIMLMKMIKEIRLSNNLLDDLTKIQVENLNSLTRLNHNVINLESKLNMIDESINNLELSVDVHTIVNVKPY